MAEFTAGLLDLPAVEAACAIALAHLDDAAAATARLNDHADHAALHDFRVAIRRLRVTIRAYPGLHETVSKKQRRRLRKLARATNAARDAEVQIAWFRARSSRFTPAQRAALSRLRTRLRAQRRRQLALTQDKLQRQFTKLERKLRRRLAAVQTDAGAHEAPFRSVAAGALVQHAHELSTRLRSLSPASKPADVHATRIASKRVRYLLEPVTAGRAAAAAVVDRLKKLQDLLGALTDGHILETALQQEGDGTAAALKVVRDEVAELFTTLQHEWSQAGPALVQQIDAVAQQLRPVVKTPPSLRQRTRRRRQEVQA